MYKNKNLSIDEAFKIAVKNQQKNKIKEAQNLYNKILEINPNHLQAHYNLGIIFEKLGELIKAKDCYENAIKIKPNYLDAYKNLGVVFYNLGEKQKTKDCYEKVIETKPNDIGALNDLGAIFLELDEYQKAKNCYEKVIEIDSNHIDALNNLGVILIELGEYQNAKNCYEKVIEIDPNYIKAYNNLGIIFKELGENKKAKDFYEKVIEIDPNHLNAQNNLGLLFYEIKEFQNAKKYFEKAIQINPGSVLASNGLLKSLYEMNNQSILFTELDSQVKEGKMNAVIGSICSRVEVKYGVKKENPFCNDPLNYVLKSDLTEKYDFKNVIVECVKNILKDSFISSRTQELLTNGYQTAGNLFTNKSFDTSEIQKIIRIEIEKYRLNFKNSNEGFLKNWPSNYNLFGWLVNMKKGGRLSAHMHDLGWLSGSIYVNVPQKFETDNGNLVVCIDGYESKSNKNKKSIDVVTGNLCLFPSSLLHYTMPFEAEEERIVLAFDMKAV